jgi:hypothetical protein
VVLVSAPVFAVLGIAEHFESFEIERAAVDAAVADFEVEMDIGTRHITMVKRQQSDRQITRLCNSNQTYHHISWRGSHRSTLCHVRVWSSNRSTRTIWYAYESLWWWLPAHCFDRLG